MTSPIAEAIAPLKTEACDRAAESYRRALTAFAEALVGTDLNVTAPYPRAWTMSTADYKAAYKRRRLAQEVCNVRQGDHRNTGAVVESIRLRAIDRMTEATREATAASFDAYVAKLEAKIGECDSATVVGRLWECSLLTVAKGGAVETWKTQQILNHSVLGNAYCQWPSRKVKAA
jgi:hypothetical protein